MFQISSKAKGKEDWKWSWSKHELEEEPEFCNKDVEDSLNGIGEGGCFEKHNARANYR